MRTGRKVITMMNEHAMEQKRADRWERFFSVTGTVLLRYDPVRERSYSVTGTVLLRYVLQVDVGAGISVLRKYKEGSWKELEWPHAALRASAAASKASLRSHKELPWCGSQSSHRMSGIVTPCRFRLHYWLSACRSAGLKTTCSQRGVLPPFGPRP